MVGLLCCCRLAVCLGGGVGKGDAEAGRCRDLRALALECVGAGEGELFAVASSCCLKGGEYGVAVAAGGHL